MSNEIHIRQAVATDADAVITLYANVIRMLDEDINYPQWEMGAHPTADGLRAAIDHGELWVADTGKALVGAAVFDHDANPGYAAGAWRVQAAPDEAYVLHLFAIHPLVRGLGVGRRMVQVMAEHARAHGAKAVRIDVIEGNAPAEAFFSKLGFVRIGPMSMTYDLVGTKSFTLYEMVL